MTEAGKAKAAAAVTLAMIAALLVPAVGLGGGGPKGTAAGKGIVRDADDDFSAELDGTPEHCDFRKARVAVRRGKIIHKLRYDRPNPRPETWPTSLQFRTGGKLKKGPTEAEVNDDQPGGKKPTYAFNVDSGTGEIRDDRGIKVGKGSFNWNKAGTSLKAKVPVKIFHKKTKKIGWIAFACGLRATDMIPGGRITRTGADYAIVGKSKNAVLKIRGQKK